MRLTLRWRAPQRCETERSDQVFLLRAPPAYQVLGVRRATRLLKRSKPLNESPSAASD